MSSKTSKNPFAVSNDAPSLADQAYLHHSRVIHKKRLRDTKSMIDNNAPREFPHLKYNAKQEQMLHDRQERIHKENMQMVSKMRSLQRPSKIGGSTYHKPNEVSLLSEICKAPPPAPTLHGIARAIKNAQINEENDRMYNRLVNVPPVHQRKAWNHNAGEKRRLAENACRFPYQDPLARKTDADMDVLLEFGVIMQEEYMRYQLQRKDPTSSSHSNEDNKEEGHSTQHTNRQGQTSRTGSRTQQRRLEYLQAHNVNSQSNGKNQFKKNTLELPTAKSRAWKTAHTNEPVQPYPHSRNAKEMRVPLNPVQGLSVGQLRGMFKGLQQPIMDQIKGKYLISGIPCSVIVSHQMTPKCMKIRILELIEFTLFEAVLSFDMLESLDIQTGDLRELANQLLHGCCLSDTNGTVELLVDVHGDGEQNPEEICHIEQTTHYEDGDNTTLPSIRRQSTDMLDNSSSLKNNNSSVPDQYHTDTKYTGSYVSHHGGEVGKPYQNRLAETLDGVALRDVPSHYFNELQAHKATQNQKQEQKQEHVADLDEPSFVEGLLALETLADDVAFDAHTTKMSKLERIQQLDDGSTQDTQKRRGSMLAKANGGSNKDATAQSSGRRGSVVTTTSSDAMFFNNLSNINLTTGNNTNNTAGRRKKKDAGDNSTNNNNNNQNQNNEDEKSDIGLHRFSKTSTNDTFKSLMLPIPDHLQDETYDYTYKNDYTAQRDFSGVIMQEETKRRNNLENQIEDVVQTAKSDPHGMLSLRVQVSCFHLCDKCTFFQETRCPHQTTAVHLYSRQNDDDDEDNEWLYADQCTEPSMMNSPTYIEDMELVFRPKTDTQFAFTVGIATGENAGHIIGTAAINAEHMLDYRDIELILIDEKGQELRKSIYLNATSVEYMQGQWVEQNKEKLRPPVCNAVIHCDEIKSMVVGGPNVRSDYHLNTTAELFYQLKGDIVLRVIDGGEFKSIPIHAGEVFLLPGGTPHSPQRSANSLGIVFEVKRDSMDGLRWYCGQAHDETRLGCGSVVYEAVFDCLDQVAQLKEVITTYYSTESLRVCAGCGKVDQPMSGPLHVMDMITTHSQVKPCTGTFAHLGTTTKIHMAPMPLDQWLQRDPITDSGMTITTINNANITLSVTKEAVLFTHTSSCDMNVDGQSTITLKPDTILRVPQGTYSFNHFQGSGILVINKL